MFIENPKRETGSTPTESHLTGKLQGYKHFTPFGVIGEPINGQFRTSLNKSVILSLINAKLRHYVILFSCFSAKMA